MPDKKGFSLIELVVVLVIIGALASLALPNYFTMMQQGAAQAAQNNLISIYNAQKTYYLTNGVYCLSGQGICNSTSSINATLSLNITDNNFTYTCSTDPFGSGFVCYGTDNTDTNLVLTLTNHPIILTGGTGCSSATGPAPCNPYCQTDITSYCPTN